MKSSIKFQFSKSKERIERDRHHTSYDKTMTGGMRNKSIKQSLMPKPIRHAKGIIEYVCDECGNIWVGHKYCPKCGLEAFDYKKYHVIA